MTPVVSRLFKLGLTSSILLGGASVCAAGWAAAARSPLAVLLDDGLPLGNKRRR